MDAAEIARLREINEKATPGPWTTERPTKDVSGFLCGVAIAAVMGGAKIYGNPPGGQYPANDQRYIAAFDPPTTRALLDAAAALEQARKERDDFAEQLSLRSESAMHVEMRELMRLNNELVAQRDAAQQDAKEARGLLARSKHSINEQYTELHARIEAMLEKKL